MTKTAFLTAYRDLLIAEQEWARNNPARLVAFMQSVERTITTPAMPWNHNSPIAKRALRRIGCKERYSLKALRALAE